MSKTIFLHCVNLGTSAMLMVTREPSAPAFPQKTATTLLFCTVPKKSAGARRSSACGRGKLPVLGFSGRLFRAGNRTPTKQRAPAARGPLDPWPLGRARKDSFWNASREST